MAGTWSGADGTRVVTLGSIPLGLPGLREAREAKLLTQQELAAAAGVDRTTISLLEAGARNAHLRTIRQLAAVLEVTAEQLLVSATPTRRSRAARRRTAPAVGTRAEH
jgi:transcriptional regulator with XRE-family HTH domain